MRVHALFGLEVSEPPKVESTVRIEYPDAPSRYLLACEKPESLVIAHDEGLE